MTPDQRQRAIRAARAMPDQKLANDWAKGAEAFVPGAWDILDDEVRQRRLRIRTVVSRADDPQDPDTDDLATADKSPASPIGLRVVSAAAGLALIAGVVGLVWGFTPQRLWPAALSGWTVLNDRQDLLLVSALIALLGALGLIGVAIHDQ